MARFIRINSISDISPRGLDGHVFRLSLDIGEVVGTEFVLTQSNKLDVSISGTLQAVWGIPDTQLASVTGSVAVTTVVDRASQGTQNPFEPVKLTTFSSPSSPPVFQIATPGTLIPIPEQKPKEDTDTDLLPMSSLSNDISKIRDQINTLAKRLIGDRLLELPQERALIDMYRLANCEDTFTRRVQSLAGLAIAINKAAVSRALGEAKLKDICKQIGCQSIADIGSVTLLEELITSYSDKKKSKSVCDVFKRLNDFRQFYPTHGDNVNKVLDAHDYFKILYPIDDYASAWDVILGHYFRAMKDLLLIVRDQRYKVARVS